MVAGGVRLVEIRPGSGRARVGSTWLEVRPTPTGLQVGPGGPVLTPISLAQRSLLVREAAAGTDAAGEVARAVALASGAAPEAAGDAVVQSLALHLSGAGATPLSFTDVLVALAACLPAGTGAPAMAAAEADALARQLKGVEAGGLGADGGQGWVTIRFGDPAGGAAGAGGPGAAEDLTPAEVAAYLAGDLLGRAAARPAPELVSAPEAPPAAIVANSSGADAGHAWPARAVPGAGPGTGRWPANAPAAACDLVSATDRAGSPPHGGRLTPGWEETAAGPAPAAASLRATEAGAAGVAPQGRPAAGAHAMPAGRRTWGPWAAWQAEAEPGGPATAGGAGRGSETAAGAPPDAGRSGDTPALDRFGAPVPAVPPLPGAGAPPPADDLGAWPAWPPAGGHPRASVRASTPTGADLAGADLAGGCLPTAAPAAPAPRRVPVDPVDVVAEHLHAVADLRGVAR